MQKYIKKYFLLIYIMILISIGLLFLCSCNKKAPDTTAKTKIEFWTIALKPTYDTYINNLIKEYESEHKDVEIEWIDMPFNVVMQKMMASIAGGDPPDVINLDSGYAQVMAQNLALVCMDDAVPADKKALYFPGLWSGVNVDGKSYAIPWYVTTRVIIYNSELFKRAGLNPDKPPKTWDEVYNYAKIIKEKTGNYGYMPAFKLLEDFQMWGVPVVSEDKKKTLFNTQAGIELTDWYVHMKNEGIMPAESLAEGYNGALNRYQSGKLGMIIAGPTLLLKIKADAPEIYKKTLVAPMPIGKGNVIPAAVMNLVVPVASKNREKAVEFALYITNDKNQLDFCKLVPLLPSTMAAAKDEFFRKGLGEDALKDSAMRISIEQLYKAKDLSLGLANSAELNRIIKEAFESAYYGRKSSKEALDDAAAKWNEVLSR